MSNEKDVSSLYCFCTISGDKRECDPPCGKRSYADYLHERWPNQTAGPGVTVAYAIPAMPVVDYQAMLQELADLAKRVQALEAEMKTMRGDNK